MANTTNYNWETPDDTDLVKDGAAAIRTLGNSIDTTTKNLNPETTTGDIAYRSATANTNTRLAIGSTGQVLTVAAGVPSWATPTDQTPLTTKGDVFTFSTVDARLGVGANGTVLTADSAEATGLKWATPAAGGGGKILQVVNANITSSVTITSQSLTDTNITATITPTSATSKILILIAAKFQMQVSTRNIDTGAAILRGATNIQSYGSAVWNYRDYATLTFLEEHFITNLHYVDSPSTTSSTTYKLQAQHNGTGNSRSMTFQGNSVSSQITLMEIGA